MRRVDFTYDSADGVSKIHTIKWVPEREPRAVLLIVHGMTEYVGRYEEYAAFLCERGFVVAGSDMLGHGESALENPLGYFCEEEPRETIIKDVHRLREIITKEFSKLPIFMFGHSMGSMMLRNYITLYGYGLEGAIICGSMMPSMAVANLMCTLASAEQLLRGAKAPNRSVTRIMDKMSNSRIKNPKTTKDWLTKDQTRVDKYVSDPKCMFAFTNNGFKCLGALIKSLHDKKSLRRIPRNLPILFIYGLEDACGGYGKDVPKVAKYYREVLGLRDVTDIAYPGDRHELLNELDREKVMEDVQQWIEKHLED